MICNICNDTGIYHANTGSGTFDEILYNIFASPSSIFHEQFVGHNYTCSHCTKGAQVRRDRDRRVQAEKRRKAQAEEKAQEEKRRRREAEAKWRREIWKVIQDLVAPCEEALKYGNLDHIDHLHKRNHLVRLKDKVHLAQEWALNEALDIPDDGTAWSRSHPNMLGVKIVSLDDREERLKWVKEKVPFALKAHEDYYHALDNYPALYQIEDILVPLRMYVLKSLPAYANDDIYINQEYQKLSSLVEAYKSGEVEK